MVRPPCSASARGGRRTPYGGASDLDLAFEHADVLRPHVLVEDPDLGEPEVLEQAHGRSKLRQRVDPYDGRVRATGPVDGRTDERARDALPPELRVHHEVHEVAGPVTDLATDGADESALPTRDEVRDALHPARELERGRRPSLEQLDGEAS